MEETATTRLETMSIAQPPTVASPLTTSNSAPPSDTAITATQSERPSTATDTKVGPPINNFPLPRELRDQIYGYLLDAEHVIAPAWHELKAPEMSDSDRLSENCPLAHMHLIPDWRHVSTAHTYHFHTSILAVNKEMHKEAKELFCKNNFVEVHYCWPEIALRMHHQNVPLVREKIDEVTRPNECTSAILLMYHPECEGHSWSGSVTLAGRDLPRFGRAMQWLFSQVPSKFDLSVGRGKEKQTISVVSPKYDQTKVVRTCMVLTDGDISSKQSDAIVRHLVFQSTAVQDFRIYLRDFGHYDEELSKKFNKILNCVPFNAPVIPRKTFYIAHILKKAADDMVTQGGERQYAVAACRYTDLVRAYISWDFLNTYLEHSLLRNRDGVWLLALFHLIADAGTTLNELNIRLQGMARATVALDFYPVMHRLQTGIWRLTGTDPLTNKSLLRGSYLLTPFLQLLRAGNAESLAQAMRMLQTAKVKAKKKPSLQLCPVRIEHDIAEVDRILNNQELLDKAGQGDPEVWKTLSCCVMPVRTFNHGGYHILDALPDELFDKCLCHRGAHPTHPTHPTHGTHRKHRRSS